MNYTYILNTLTLFTVWVFVVFVVGIILVFSILIIKLIKKEKIGSNFDYIFQRVAELLIFYTIIALIVTYYFSALLKTKLSLMNISNPLILLPTKLLVVSSLVMSIILVFAALFIEIRHDKSLLLKEIENTNISKLKKTLIVLFIDIIPPIVTLIILLCLMFLTTSSVNTLMVNIILGIIPINIVAIIFDIMSSIAIIVSGKKLANIEPKEITFR